MRLKGSKPKVLIDCPSFQGLLVAEAEESVGVDPDSPEEAKVEPEVTAREAVHARHPAAAVGIFPETILFIERGIPFTFRQLVALLFEDEGSPLSAGMDGLLSCQERHAFLRGGRALDDLLERANAELVARLQNASRFREILVGDVVVVVVELVTVLLAEHRQPFVVHVVVEHRDDAEVCEQVELFLGFSRRRGLRSRLFTCHERIAFIFAETIKPLEVVHCDVTLSHLLQQVDLQTSQFGRICVDGIHRYAFRLLWTGFAPDCGFPFWL